MKNLQRHQLARSLAVLAAGFAAVLAVTHAAPPSLQPLLQGNWPGWRRGEARDVKIVGNYSFVALGAGGLAVFNVSNPANPVRVGGYDTSGDDAEGVAVWGNYAYVASDIGGWNVIDVSNPTNCLRVGGDNASGVAYGVAVVAGRIYVAAGDAGLLVVPILRNVQFTVRVDATPNQPFTLEAATNLNAPIPWTPLLTINVPAMPFDYVDFDVKLSNQAQKYYRVRQP